MKQTINVLGLNLHPLSMEAAVEAIVADATSSKPAGYVVRPHAVFIEQALKQPELMKLLNSARFCLVDGVALQWAAYYLSKPRRNPANLATSLAGIPLQSKKTKSVITERIAGTTFTHALLQACAQQGASVYLIGNPQRVSIAHTANYLQKLYPKLKLAGTFSAKRTSPKHITISGAQEKQLQKQLAVLKPDVILIGLAFPRQEQVMASLSAKLNHGLFIGEGGTFDYKDFGGHIRRAPTALRRSGLEWAWRLARQPKRLKRQMAIPRFIWQVYKWPKGK